MLSTEYKREVAETILQQLGGREFLVMTGSRNLCYGEDEEGNPFLNMRLHRNQGKTNMLRITLKGDDTYTMTFKYVRRGYFDRKTGKMHDDIDRIVKEWDGIYCDMLQDLFEDATGLYVTLYPRRA